MTSMQSLKDLLRGIKRHPWKTTGYIFTAFSVLFTIIKGVNQFFPGVKVEGPFAFAVIILVSVIFGLKKVWKPSSIKITVANSDTKIEVLFGDLFAQDGIRAIAVNEFFDSALGKAVSEKSLHGLFLNKCFGGYPQPFDKQVDEQLAYEPHEVVPRAEGKTRKFKIGATAMVNADKDRYLAFALSHTDVTNGMAPEHLEPGSPGIAGAGRITHGAGGGVTLFEKVVRAVWFPHRRWERSEALLPAHGGILAMNLAARSSCSPSHWSALISSDFPILAAIIAAR